MSNSSLRCHTVNPEAKIDHAFRHLAELLLTGKIDWTAESNALVDLLHDVANERTENQATIKKLTEELAELRSVHEWLLQGACRVDCLLAEIEQWDTPAKAAVESTREQLLDSIILADPDYLRWTIPEADQKPLYS